jgi:hypothetical protein
MGKAKYNAVSMKGRYEIKDSQMTPGPGAYSSDSSSKAPAYSIRSRPNDTREMTTTPGPGAYAVKGTVGTSPGKSFAGRHDLKSNEANPGPGAYNTVGGVGGKGGAPAYTMRIRPDDPKAMTSNPGPGETYFLHCTL